MEDSIIQEKVNKIFLLSKAPKSICQRVSTCIRENILEFGIHRLYLSETILFLMYDNNLVFMSGEDLNVQDLEYIDIIVIDVHFLSFISLQSILNASNQLAFMIKESQYMGGPEGSIPVLVNSVRRHHYNL